MRTRRLLQRATAFLVGATLVGMLALSVMTTLLVRETQLDGVERAKETRANTEILKVLARDNKATLDLVEDCTSPGGECYDRGTRRTGEAVGTINQITIYAAACAKQPQNVTVRQIQACVEELLGEAD